MVYLPIIILNLLKTPQIVSFHDLQENFTWKNCYFQLKQISEVSKIIESRKINKILPKMWPL